MFIQLRKNLKFYPDCYFQGDDLIELLLTNVKILIANYHIMFLKIIIIITWVARAYNPAESSAQWIKKYKKLFFVKLSAQNTCEIKFYVIK